MIALGQLYETDFAILVIMLIKVGQERLIVSRINGGFNLLVPLVQ